MKKIVLGALALALATCGGDSPSDPSEAPAPPPPNVRVSRPENPRPEEVAIAIDPTNPARLVVGSNLDFYYYSWDTGLTWTEARLLAPSFGVWGDPSIAYDADGRVYYAHLSNPPEAEGFFIDRIVVQRSTDGGASFDDGEGVGLRPPKNQDKSWLVSDLTDSAYRGRLYLAWTEFDRYGSDDPADRTRILLSHSADAGKRWSEPVVVSDVEGDARDDDNTVEGAVPAIGPQGQVYLSWGGPLGLMFDKSLDGGRTFGRDLFVTDQPGGWAFAVSGLRRANGMPVTLCDTSGSPHRGRIYVVWSDQRSGPDDTDVFSTWSDDEGQTWVAPVRVNDDGAGRHQFFHWAAVDPVTGHLHVVFYDRRNTQGDATEVFVARSTDGGATFQNRRVSESPFTPDTSLFFGDYNNIAARDGQVYPLWTRMEGGRLGIWTALIDERTFW